MKVRFFSSFCDGKEIKSIIERIFESSLIPEYNNTIIVSDNDDYTHVIILNTAMPNISHIPKENVIGLAFEPPYYLGLSTTFVEYASKYIGKYFIGDKYDLPSPFMEHYSFMFHCTPLSYIPLKQNSMSIIISNKQSAPGHKYRHDMVKAILNTKLPIDIYGNGCFLYQNMGDSRIKGKFDHYEPYLSYSFHITIENFQTNRYFSEKIINPLLCSTVPIYLGCNHIEEYFPDATIPLSGNIKDDMVLIHNIFLNPSKYKKNIDLSSVKKSTNLLLNLGDIFS